MNRKQQFLLFGCVILFGLLIAGCSSKQSSTLPVAPTNPNQAVPTTSQALALPSDTPLPAIPNTAPTANTQAVENTAPPAESTETAGTPVPGSAEATAEPARPSNPGGPGQAVSLTGDPNNGKATFNQVCAACHGPDGTKGIANAGSNDGEVPAINPIDATIANSDPKAFAQNVDLFLEHGSTPAGPSPTTKMPAFGDTKILTPQQIADVISYVVALNSPTASVANTEVVEPTVAETAESTVEAAKPSNPGGPGPAVSLTGDATSGKAIFGQICAACHGPDGTKGIANAGSNDGEVPAINPIDETIANPDMKVFAQNVDLFLEHGSTPEGPNPATKMPAFGDTKILTPQQIADVIAYVISLNTKK